MNECIECGKEMTHTVTNESIRKDLESSPCDVPLVGDNPYYRDVSSLHICTNSECSRRGLAQMPKEEFYKLTH